MVHGTSEQLYATQRKVNIDLSNSQEVYFWWHFLHHTIVSYHCRKQYWHRFFIYHCFQVRSDTHPTQIMISIAIVAMNKTMENTTKYIWSCSEPRHRQYNDGIKRAMTSSIPSLTIVYSILYSGTDSKETSKLCVTDDDVIMKLKVPKRNIEMNTVFSY